MKVYFDTNVYVAEALLGQAASALLEATAKAGWRTYTSSYLLAELERVMVERLDCTRRFAILTRRRARRRATLVDPPASRHQVPDDPPDSPILQAALAAGVDYVVTNDDHLLALSPYEGLRFLSMSGYRLLLWEHGLLRGRSLRPVGTRQGSRLRSLQQASSSSEYCGSGFSRSPSVLERGSGAGSTPPAPGTTNPSDLHGAARIRLDELLEARLVKGFG
jgi:putative PIN family toxin of toxin-antitoxin system